MSKNEFDALLLKKLQEEAFEFDPKSWQQLSERLNTSMPVPDKMPPFDALLHEKLAEEAFEYKPQSWQRLSQKLDEPALGQQEKERTVIPFASGKNLKIALGTAAAICMLVALGITLNRSDKNVLDKVPSMAKKSIEKPVIKQDENKGNDASTSTPSSQQNLAGTAQTQHNTTQHPLPGTVQNTIVNTPANVPPVLQTQVTPVEITPTEKQLVVQPDEKKNEVDLFNKKMMALVPKSQPSDAEMALRNASDNWPGNYQQTGNSEHHKAKTNVALGGGVNYGNLNTGYTAAATIKRKIGGDFFVDGTVGMLYNNNANNVAVNNGPPISGVASRPSSAMSSISSPALDPIQRLYYVQVNPSLGYQLEDKIGLSVGGDFQKMLGGNDEVVQPQNDNTKIFPTLDIGITTKTEFTITPNLQAGVVYREGINNLISSDAGKYVNRRYLQVQFKYNIPMGGK